MRARELLQHKRGRCCGWLVCGWYAEAVDYGSLAAYGAHYGVIHEGASLVVSASKLYQMVELLSFLISAKNVHL